MKPEMDYKVKIPKFNIVGKEKEEFFSYTKTIGIGDDIQSDISDYVIITDGTPDIDYSEKFVAAPYCRDMDNSKINCKKMITYAIEDNGADVVGKNVRVKEDFTAFELLSGFGIGRVYVDGRNKKYPKYALALASGIMLSGIDLRTAVKIVSNRKN